ncbi:MAG: putative toxin-antitoxin system toxin component, PIN family [Gammaproteobacteria bacterium]|nr:putative toxin-antitoxin system toxin component, PIN family [Gammaproteobacteria bacterium]
MSRVVLDTNVWLALWFFREPGVDALREALARGDLVPVRSAATDFELAEVLARPGLFDVAPRRQVDLLRQWESLALLVGDIAPAPCRCRDPDDQKFLDLALCAGARWLITRDRDLLKLRKKVRAAGLAIVAPAGYPGTGSDLSSNSPEILLNPGAG